MKKAGVLLLLLIVGVAAMYLLPQDPAIRAQDDAGNKEADLLARIEVLEDLLSYHSHERELKEILARLHALEGSRVNQRAAQVDSSPSLRTQPAPANNELRALKQDVQSLASKLSAVERTVGPLKQEIASLRLAIGRVESSVARIDLRR